jgi:hypothetical protein
MNDIELILTMLGEATTTKLHQSYGRIPATWGGVLQNK